MTRRDLDDAIRKIARDQHGAFTANQVVDEDGDHNLVARRVRAGHWVKLGPGVYALAGTPDTWKRRLAAAQLAHPGSLVSGTSALKLHGLPGGTTGKPQLTMPSGSSGHSTLARVRRMDGLPWLYVDDLKVVTTEQAVCDVAGPLGLLKAEHALDHGLVAGLVGLERFGRRVRVWSAARRAGATHLRALLEEREGGAAVPESVLERKLYRAIERARPPSVLHQVPAPWDSSIRLDALVPDWRLVIEGDGRRWHTRMADFERDRIRDQRAAVAGYLSLRFTWVQLTRASSEVVATIRDVGATRSANPRS